LITVVLSAETESVKISATRLLFRWAKPSEQPLSPVKGGVVKKRQKNPFARAFYLFLISTILLAPFTVIADPLVFVRIADEADKLKLRKVKLSATLKTDKNGDMVVQCLNLFSIPVAHAPFCDKPGIQKLVERTRLQVEQKGRGVFVKLTFMF
jgi:hypothetical protein